MTQFARGTRRGFALPVVLMALFILTGALAGGFAMLRGERAADDATVQANAAAALAETGLQQGLGNRVGLGLAARPTGTDSVRLTLAGGYVDIVSTLIRAQAGTNPGYYFVRTRGVRTRTGVSGSGNAVATASSFASFNTVNMSVQSAMTSSNGISKAGNSGAISGVDACTAGNGGGRPTLPAVAVPTNPGYSGQTGPLTGNPTISYIGATESAAAAAIPIDWNAIVNNNAISAQFDLPASGVGFPASTYFSSDTTRFPTIIIRNGPNPETEYTLSAFGRGTLIVFGSLRLNGNTAGWDGIILVGGKLRSNGTNQVRGATVTGLNMKLGFNLGENELTDLNGTKAFLYHSCYVTRALQNVSSGGLSPVQSTFANSFPTY